jgi:hypothetical protein
LPRAHVTAIEIRTDTWDAGFVLSVDALSFKKQGGGVRRLLPGELLGPRGV